MRAKRTTKSIWTIYPCFPHKTFHFPFFSVSGQRTSCYYGLYRRYFYSRFSIAILKLKTSQPRLVVRRKTRVKTPSNSDKRLLFACTGKSVKISYIWSDLETRTNQFKGNKNSEQERPRLRCPSSSPRSQTDSKPPTCLSATNGRIHCQDDEKEKTAEDIPLRTQNNSNLDLIHRDLIHLDTRPESSNTEDETKDIFSKDYYKIRFFRSRRSAPEKSIASIRKRLNEERKREREELMAADANPRMEPNETTGTAKHGSLGYEYSGMNSEQLYNKKTDKIRQLHAQQSAEQQHEYESGIDCDFETDCLWTWRKDIANGFYITSGGKFGANDTGPRTDADGREGGSFLLIRLPITRKEYHVTSPLFGPPTTTVCKFALSIYQEEMDSGLIKIVTEKKDGNHTQTILKIIGGLNNKKWIKYEMQIGKLSTNFTIILEVVASENMRKAATVAFDNIHLFTCYHKNDDTCTPHQYKCKTTKTCINSTSICDITVDCPHGDDETQNCDLMPYGARCNFEDDWCGWENIDVKTIEWTRHNGSTPTNFTGPNYDHTYKNSTGSYLYVNMLKENAQFANAAILRSVYFNPPPRVHNNASSRFYNSCSIRFYFHKFGKHKSAMSLNVIELRPSENVSTEILWSYSDHGDQWVRQVITLPKITHRYYITFEARKGLRYISDVAIDDVSLSPECFGLNIPAEELKGYNYWYPMEGDVDRKESHADFINKTYYEITTCNAKGRYGPTHRDCSKAYNKTTVMGIKVMHEEAGLTGVQKWVVPKDGFYTFILAGAGGGKGSSAMGSSRGAIVRTVINLEKDQEIYMLIGQEGTSSCVKSLAAHKDSSCHSKTNIGTGIRGVLYMDITDSGGGGGGGTFMFVRDSRRIKIPVAVAGGGGGLGLGRFSVDSTEQHGHGIKPSKLSSTGNSYGNKFSYSGAGGGWERGLIDPLHKQTMGRSLLDGGIGGQACYNSTDHRGDGGFGGGGGGCTYGGGGGGYAGGDGPFYNMTYGEGGYSYINPNITVYKLSDVQPGKNPGSGYVMIIPETDGCDCDFKCVALDGDRSTVSCICPPKWKLNSDNKSCVAVHVRGEGPYPTWFVVILIVTVFFLTAAFGAVCFVLYNRYQQRTLGIVRRKMGTGPDFQLDRLRVASDSMMTEYNPNYEFGGVTYTLKDLKDIPREQLRLVKALGQGAFGEVYQGFYRQRPCDMVELPVAVKTLPEMSTSQAEMDFLMEALIMSKFNHPNIVHFIGVCFDKHPRFIVLELLSGGDLKNFLRESRPKPEKTPNAVTLTMKDLILISVDVAKGCKYLEDNRFIHRDIAARNCLLTTKGPGRVVKIADFGMSRDVYRSDYYRKGGKAMLPIKWMPPEAFLDGIFTSKTDVWSFGVLLWEIMSMGYMPYTGCANRDVMQLVTSGGRLDPPANCPGPIYGIMTQCWHPQPEQRPNFGTILERLGYCVQDPQVMTAPLPVFQRPPSNERDTTVMRPTSSEENCLQVVPTSSDYLIPNHTNPTTPDQIESTSSVEKLLPDNSDNWETSFIMPHSRSTQPLLMDNNREDEGATSVDKLLSIDNTSQHISKISPISLPTSILTPSSNHNNNIKTESSLKSGVSLDPGALAKQAMTSGQNKKYANVTTGEGITSNGVLQNDPFSNHIGNSQKSEINC